MCPPVPVPHQAVTPCCPLPLLCSHGEQRPELLVSELSNSGQDGTKRWLAGPRVLLGVKAQRPSSQGSSDLEHGVRQPRAAQAPPAPQPICPPCVHADTSCHWPVFLRSCLPSLSLLHGSCRALWVWGDPGHGLHGNMHAPGCLQGEGQLTGVLCPRGHLSAQTCCPFFCDPIFHQDFRALVPRALL